MEFSRARDFKIGFSADLRSYGSIHTNTFLRAIAYIESVVLRNVSLSTSIIMASDNAHPEMASEAAAFFVSQNVDVVIGHFYSGAALAAMEIYEANNIPLLLPAATSDELTYKFDRAFRVCANDGLQAKTIANFIGRSGYKNVRFVTDGSKSSEHLLESIRIILLGFEISLNNKFDLIVYIGRFDLLPEFQEGCDYILSDDNYHPKLFEMYRPAGVRIYVIGFSDHSAIPAANAAKEWHWVEYGERYNCYFMETVAASQIAIGAFHEAISQGVTVYEALSSKSYESAVGSVQFIHGENKNSGYRILRLENDKFIDVS